MSSVAGQMCLKVAFVCFCFIFFFVLLVLLAVILLVVLDFENGSPEVEPFVVFVPQRGGFWMVLTKVLSKLGKV